MTPGSLSLCTWPDGTECKALLCGREGESDPKGRGRKQEKQLCMGVETSRGVLQK